jgi:hypothetical protein
MPPASAALVAETPEDLELGDQLHQLTNEVTHFFEEAEKNISADHRLRISRLMSRFQSRPR